MPHLARKPPNIRVMKDKQSQYLEVGTTHNLITVHMRGSHDTKRLILLEARYKLSKDLVHKVANGFECIANIMRITSSSPNLKVENLVVKNPSIGPNSSIPRSSQPRISLVYLLFTGRFDYL